MRWMRDRLELPPDPSAGLGQLRRVLAVSGVVLQSLLRNALAEPYLLGISAGASTGAVLIALTGLGAGIISMSLGAFIGALTAFLFVALLAMAAGGRQGGGVTTQIILAGIASSQLSMRLHRLSSPAQQTPSKHAVLCSGCWVI